MEILSVSTSVSSMKLSAPWNVQNLVYNSSDRVCALHFDAFVLFNGISGTYSALTILCFIFFRCQKFRIVVERTVQAVSLCLG